MKQPILKLFSLLTILTFTFSLMPGLVGIVSAAQLTGVRDTLSDSRPATSSTHTFTFTANSSSTLREIRFVYVTQASGGGSTPASLVTTTGTLGTVVNLDGGWSLDASTNGTLKVQHVDSGESISSNTVVTVPVNTVTNHAIDDCQSGGDTSSDTCFIRVNTYSDLGTTTVDETIITYTVISAVTVTARVDPTFTFVVAGVNASTVNSAITTSAASTFNTLPFGNLTAQTPKYLAHELTITTNSDSGYTVTMTMLTQMAGTYTGNNVDPFNGTGVSWGAPIGWTEPTGSTPNTDTAWIGANTTDNDVSGWTADEVFGPVNTTANIVMQDADSDDGSTSVYVTYGIEANVFQPADTYTGTVVYNALPAY